MFLRSQIFVLVACINVALCATRVPCCAPSTSYSGKMQITTVTMEPGSTEAVATQNSLIIYHDSDLQMTRVDGNVATYRDASNTTVDYSVLIDGQNNKTYNSGAVGGYRYCNNTDVGATQSFALCVPDTLKADDDDVFTFGSGSEQVSTVSWAGSAGGYIWSAQTSVADCTPVAITRTKESPTGRKEIEYLIFADFVFAKPNATLFTIPDQC